MRTPIYSPHVRAVSAATLLTFSVSTLITFAAPKPVEESGPTPVPGDTVAKVTGKAPVAKRSSNQIDALLARSWKEAGVKPNPPASDEVFVRRVYLDVIGRIPTYEESKRFLDSGNPAKRAELIDELLASEGYVNHYYNFWADILRINTATAANQNVVPFYIDWVREALRTNMPYDKLVRELVTAEGQAWENGAAGYYTRDRGMPLDNMANTVRIFLGTRLECAQCHDHPFDDWTQMDFFNMAAFSFGVNPNGQKYGVINTARSALKKEEAMPEGRKKDINAAITEVTRVFRNNFEVTHTKSLPKLPHDYRYDDGKPNAVVQPRTMFGADPEVTNPEDRLEIYADWMTSPENPYFTTVIANRLWNEVMGVGLYDSVDEFTAYTKASHPELMKFLEGQMVANRYDMKAFLRLILNSQVYQREATGRDLAGDETYAFTGPLLRRMSAEQIWDSIVALVNPTPEMDDWKRDQLTSLRLAEQKAMQEVLHKLTEAEMLEAAAQIAGMQKDVATKEDRLREQIQAAKKAGEKQKASELEREVNALRSELRTRMVEMVFHPEMKEIGVAEVAMAMPNGAMVEMSPMMMDGGGNSSAELKKVQAETEKAMIETEMASLGMEDASLRKQYEGFRKSSMSSMLRAANLASPAPAGHFLREFGQSDRNTIENASTDASVPQALALLNGSAFGQVVHPQSVFSRTVAEAGNEEEKLERIFLSIVSRKPTPVEKKHILSHREDRGGNLYADTAFALLNGQEFWFIQ